MTAEMLRRCGEALYGERWQTALAEALSVSDRTVRYWLAGASAIPDGVVEDLRRLLHERYGRIAALLAETDRKEKPMRHEFVPIDQPLDAKGTIARTVEDVERLCPWAEAFVAAVDGFHAFESPADVETWWRQRTTRT